MPVYVSEYAAELRTLGHQVFAVRYPCPVLVVKGVSGNLKDSSGKGGTLVTEDIMDHLRQASLLIGRVFLLRKGRGAAPGPVTIGRTAGNDVPIPEYSISQRHCMVRLELQGALLSDTGSTNGTFVDGTRLLPQKPVLLGDGTEITLGRFVFVFHTAAGFSAMLATQS
ncbi:MAG: FHA domain-containing protein [Myxococcales bacterium]|nr:FHA domain-containing protein [Myxococcales bacterium]